MTTYDKQKLTETVVYILNKTGAIGYYHVFKILYFANAKLLAKYGKNLVADKFFALPDGPVPSLLFDALKGDRYHCDYELTQMLDNAVEHGVEDAFYIISPTREPNLDFLSKADMQVLDNSINENASLTFAQLREKSHGNEWRRAFAISGAKIMEDAGIALDEGATEDMAEYIREMQNIQQALL